MADKYLITLHSDQLRYEYGKDLEKIQEIEEIVRRYYLAKDELDCIRTSLERKYPLYCRGKEDWSTINLVNSILGYF